MATRYSWWKLSEKVSLSRICRDKLKAGTTNLRQVSNTNNYAGFVFPWQYYCWHRRNKHKLLSDENKSSLTRHLFQIIKCLNKPGILIVQSEADYRLRQMQRRLKDMDLSRRLNATKSSPMIRLIIMARSSDVSKVFSDCLSPWRWTKRQHTKRQKPLPHRHGWWPNKISSAFRQWL